MTSGKAKEAITLMTSFAERTGLTSASTGSAQRPPTRYLWTDAFAVCNFLGLNRLTGEARYKELALQLVDQVHSTLGKHRLDDPQRSGWLSGLREEEGLHHPTRGGLRIGKKLPERGSRDSYDDDLEWDRDGQYFHYLTKWMHALDQTSRATGQPQYNMWGRELAAAAHHAFAYQASPGSHVYRMYWKMSIDLRRPLVPSMGHHDPLDGYITHTQLSHTASHLKDSPHEPVLSTETSQLGAMVRQDSLATTDPLGLGGLLMDTYRVHQLTQQGAVVQEHLLQSLVSASLVGLESFATSRDLRRPADHRLAFRELGLSIGLHAVDMMDTGTEGKLGKQVQALKQYDRLRDDIETFWRSPDHQRSRTWLDHRDINEVMLATSLAPEGFLQLPASN